MKTSDFSFELPPEQIAQQPAPHRTAARLLVVHRSSGQLEHRQFSDVTDYLGPGDLLVLNNTKVIPARAYGRKKSSGGQVEFLFLEEVEPGTWDVLLRASRRPQPGQSVVLDPDRLEAVILDHGEQGRARVRIEGTRSLQSYLEECGETPLPPYIRRASGHDVAQADRERYQTVYATHPGAVAAPTAGLHFDHALLNALQETGVNHCSITLHVGLGTFRPVSCRQVQDHVMDAERYEVPQAAVSAIEHCRAAGGRIVAVGSTSVRTLESSATEGGRLSAGTGRTNLFIYPPYEFRVVDAMITNFHLPQSTLLMMVSAFAGIDLVRHAYEVAVQEKYRFFSYGDSMLLL